MKMIHTVVLALLGGACGFGVARSVRGHAPVAEAPPASANSAVSALPAVVSVPQAFSVALAEEGAQQLPAFHETLRSVTTNTEIERLAQRLLSNQANSASDSLWGLLLARWSQIDPVAMVAFVDGQGGHAALPKMRKMAFEAWGSVDPDGAFAAVRSRAVELRRGALVGMAKRFPERAAQLALKMPDAQFAISSVVRNGELSEETLEHLWTRSIYDGSKKPINEARIDRLVKSDPAAALELSQNGSDVFPAEGTAKTLAKIAREDASSAIELLEEMPASRNRAMAAVRVTGVWAAQDETAALAWARDSLDGPVRGAALVEVAAVVGGRDPYAGLALIEEAGWDGVRKFFEPVTIGNGSGVSMKQNFDQNSAVSVAKTLLYQLFQTDPAAARQFIARADESVQQELGTVLNEQTAE